MSTISVCALALAEGLALAKDLASEILNGQEGVAEWCTEPRAIGMHHGMKSKDAFAEVGDQREGGDLRAEPEL
jgi:hypothetical protein